MRPVRSLMIVAYGLVAIAAQTLLFREFVTAFEGNDISVGVFFGSWFLWVGLGAVLVRRWDQFAETLLEHIEPLFLLYIPAFLLQLVLILSVRHLSGLAAYDLMSIQTIVLWAMVVNAPVSLVTGMLFPVACRWVEQSHAFAVSRMYILEAVGSFIGGLAVTALLARRVHTVRVALLLAVALSVPVAVVCLLSRTATPLVDGGSRVRRNRRIAFAVSLLVAALAITAILTGADAVLVRRMQAAKWSKLLPRKALIGAFHTAQAEYLYGEYGGQWIAMREGSVCEALPDEEEAGRIAATVLCQNPQAGRILVVGSSLALCSRFLALPQVEHVAWAHPDAEYAQRLLEVIPGRFTVGDGRFHPVAREIRRYLGDSGDSFDLIVLNMSDIANSALNRYCTVEFYKQLKGSLREGGAAAVGIVGSENTLGTELAGLGASALATLREVFANVVLAPGEQTWLIASDSSGLTDDPATARDRFGGIAGSERVFPAVGMLSVYLPDRVSQTMLAYDRVDLPERLLINRDSRPLAYLYGLLLTARQSGASVTRFVRLLALGGWLPFMAPILVFVALRTLAMTERRPIAGPSSFDSVFLVFSTGWVAIGVVILLMYLYETQFGSLYLHVGLISSLFMAGLTAGALLASRLVARRPGGCPVRVLLVAVLPVHAVVLSILALHSAAAGEAGLRSGHALFAVAFVLSGLSCGGYWPIASAQLATGKLNPGEVGSRLETADHLGACLGGLATSLLMVPVLGPRVSLMVLAGLVLANLPSAIAGLRGEAETGRLESAGLRYAGYVMFGVGAAVVLCSNILAGVSERMQPTLPPHAIVAMAGEQPTRHTSTTLESTGRKATYVTMIDADQNAAGYLFSSADFAPRVRGFGGRLNLAVHTDPSGKLIDVLVVRSNETPSYIAMLHDWLESLRGTDVFGPDSLADVDAVAGATVSSDAILASLRTSGRQFAAEVLKTGVAAGTRDGVVAARLPDAAALYLAAAALLTLAAVYRGGARSRVALLALSFVLGGIVLNAQYSIEQVATLLSFDTPRAGLTGVFLLAAGVPILVLLFGNLYCGYICPFGAAQELLGHVLPRRFRPALPSDPMRAARFIKYVLLLVIVAGFFITRDRRTLAGDPLTSIFILHRPAWSRSGWTPAIVGSALAGSLFYVRFWCRYLCPAGAFLSLFNRIRLLRRWVPVEWFGRCEFGLTAADHLDCLYCDRCRHIRGPETATVKPPIQAGVALVLATVLVGLLVAGVSLSQFRLAMPQILQDPVATVGAAGRPRDVDAQRMRSLIEQGRLSDREAEHYRHME